jgi:hypothetical protein
MADATNGAEVTVVRSGDDEMVRLEAEIALKRERVTASFGELRRRVQGATSWRHWAASHPIVWIGAGLCLGFIVGSGGRNRRGTE